MQIELEGRSLTVPPEYVETLAEELWAMMESLYATKIDDTVKVGLMAITRALLVKEELSVRMKYGKEAARAMRPPPKADPNLWLARMFLPAIRESLNGTTLICETAGETVTNFALSIPDISFTGGQMDTAGGVGLRENHSLKVS